MASASEVEDCEIDDPELMGKKKDILCRKATPISMIKILQDKHKTLYIKEDLE